MATTQITNYSDVELWVHYDDGQAYVLKPLHRTKLSTAAQPRRIKPRKERQDYNYIFGTDGWWEFRDHTEVFVYPMSTWSLSTRPFRNELSLHTLPVPSLSTLRPEQCRTPEDHDPVDITRHDTSDRTESVDSKPDAYGEVCEFYFDPIWGLRQFIRTRNHISVRIKLACDDDLPGDRCAALDTVYKPEWSKAIETRWNGMETCPGETEPMVFHPEWVDLGEHFCVTVYEQLLLLGKDWTSWSWEAQSLGQDPSIERMYYQVAAHEFGHMLGLRDEYLTKPEKAFFAENFENAWWYRLGISVMRGRILERLLKGKKCENPEPTIMEESLTSETRKASPKLIRCICQRVEQDLCWHPRMLKRPLRLRPSFPEWMRE
jgi:hypothetical protein